MMTIEKDTTVKITDGEFQVHMGKGMTSFHFKEKEKFVFYTHEVDKLILMLQTAKNNLNNNP